MPYIREVRLARAIHLAVSSCTTTRCCCRVGGLRVFRSHPRGPRGYSMQDPASEYPRILLPRTSVNKRGLSGIEEEGGRELNGIPEGAVSDSGASLPSRKISSIREGRAHLPAGQF